MSATTPVTQILFLGKDRCYCTNSAAAIVVTETEDCVLRAFLGRPSMSSRQLEEKSGYPSDTAVITLHRLKKRYKGIFAGAIDTPGAKSVGGYRVNIIEKT